MDPEHSLSSPVWYRVASLTPRLRGHVRVERQRLRGDRWYLLVDGTTQRAHRIDARAWAFVGLCDGERSVEQIWQATLKRGEDDAPTQGEVVELLSRLHEAGLMQANLPVDAERLHDAACKRRRRQRRAAVNPFSFRVAVGDPSALLDRIAPWAGRLFDTPALLLWAALVGTALLLAIGEAGALQAHAARWLASQHYLALMWLAYPPIKALHEAAHALAVRRFGGDVREVGVTLLLLTPVPYVDASAANAFRERRERVLVSAAGIMAELGIAAIALFVWLAVENGLLRDLAFVTMFIGAASTVLVNGNPLVRMDGYHAASDLLELPNLAERSRRWHSARLQRLFSGHTGAPGPVPSRGETTWLAVYAPASWLYRALLSVWIVGWLGSIQAWMGYAAALALGWGLVGAPLVHLAASLLAPTLPDALRRRARWRLGLVALALTAVVAAVPVRQVTAAQGVVWLPEHAWIRAGTDGFVHRFAQADGAAVSAGALLLELADDQLIADRDAAQQRLDGVRSQLYATLAIGGAGAGGLQPQIDAAEAALQRLDKRIAELSVRARAAGQLVLPHPGDMEGRWVARGDTLGHVLPAGNRTVRVALPHEQALLVAGDLHAIELRTLDAPSRVLSAPTRVTVPAAMHRLPAKALGQPAGGDIVVDPEDTEGLTARDAIAVFDLEVSAPLGERVGTRVAVRFTHSDEPLMWQALRRARQLLLRHFRPAL
jgi:putative peptide zinc metalloprotease protein